MAIDPINQNDYLDYVAMNTFDEQMEAEMHTLTECNRCKKDFPISLMMECSGETEPNVFVHEFVCRECWLKDLNKGNYKFIGLK